MSENATQTPQRITSTKRGLALVTGVTGYIGGELVEPLLEAGWQVRVLTRSADKLADIPWRTRVEVCEGDATSSEDLDKALAGVDVAYYLLHSMDNEGDFVRRDKELAQGFAQAATRAKVGRIAYLGGLHPDGEELSPHLASRVEVGQVFLDSEVPAACLQAAIVIGDESASFQMLRHLTERLPAMLGPKWLRNRIQPIAIADVVHYLVGVADLPAEVNRTFDIGGPEVLRYTEMIDRYAKVAGLPKRPIVTVPVLTPRLASSWVGLVTPISAGLARPLVSSLVHEVVCKENDIAQYVPEPEGGLTGFDDAVRTALSTVKPSRGRRNLLIATTATGAAAVIGSIASDPKSSWYRSLDTPSWRPPAAAFPIVWTALFATIAGTSGSAVTALQDDDRSAEATAYWSALATNLGLNAAWSVFFFRARAPWVAAAGAAALTASSADLARRAGKASSTHRNLLLPYALWCGFATALSTEIARRNPEVG
ncbi:tryptophan-rich sensory protein [Gephyromycinifex aptenodytis]|uniref:tryptophan-rich sensory protein n=1 Tax=Gephyromycinifex aptenodytis TaxID=2716227 RepID=UPI001B2FF997|nr:tryptophan-rich sensory protein [Gephyromycinifex aptenodytis]